MPSFNLFEALTRLEGYYECPKDGNGGRLGPLVGYTARDEQGRQLVGEVYVNFSCLEESPLDLRAAAKALVELIRARSMQPDAVLAMPMGALALGVMVAEELSTQENVCRYLFAENEPVPSKEVGGKPERKLLLARHIPKMGERILILEDVGNNFSTSGEAIRLVEQAGAVVVGVACVFNRSPEAVDAISFQVGDTKREFPLVALARKVFPSYRQDDPLVAESVAAGNVVLSAKKEWGRLKEAMLRHTP